MRVLKGRRDHLSHPDRWTHSGATRSHLYHVGEAHRVALREPPYSHLTRRTTTMTDRMTQQRPAGDAGGREQGGSEDRRLARRGGSRELRPYRGYGVWASPFELMRRFSEDVDR